MAFGKDLRKDILHRRRVAIADLQRIAVDDDAKVEREHTPPDMHRLRAAALLIERCTQAYWEGIPRVQIAACPYCAEPLVRAFDLFDVDGDYFCSGHDRGDGPTCEHFSFYRGAIDFEGLRPPKPPRAPLDVARIGPGVPYVLAFELDRPGVTAVIGELVTEPRWRAYSIAYFAQTPRARAGMPLDWALPESRAVRTSEPAMAQSASLREAWDFQLQPWIDRGKLRFCVPGSRNRLLAPADAACPYVGLAGRRYDLVLRAREPIAPG